MSLQLLGLPGWLRSETDPIRHALVPDWMRHLYRTTKERVQPNPNIDAVALSRGIDFETAHYLAPRWSTLDVSDDSQRHRCGLAHNKLPSNFDRRWLSACKGVSAEFMDNEFRDQFTDAVQRGREVERATSSNNGYTPILDNGDNDVSNEEVLIFWKKGESAPTFLGAQFTDIPGPCVVRGVVAKGRFGGDIQKCKCSDNVHASHLCPPPAKTICYVKVVFGEWGVPFMCGEGGEGGERAVIEDFREEIIVERSKIYRYVEAAQISKRLVPYVVFERVMFERVMFDRVMFERVMFERDHFSHPLTQRTHSCHQHNTLIPLPYSSLAIIRPTRRSNTGTATRKHSNVSRVRDVEREDFLVESGTVRLVTLYVMERSF